MDSLDVEDRENYEYHQRKEQQEKSSSCEFAPNENYGGDGRGEQKGDCTVLPNVLVTPRNDQHKGRPHNGKDDGGGMPADCRKTGGHIGHGLHTVGHARWRTHCGFFG